MTNTANYRGDRTRYDTDSYVGPDRFNAFYRPTSATYNPGADTTTIQYLPVPLTEMSARYGHKIDNTIIRAEIAELFGGTS